MALLPFTSR